MYGKKEIDDLKNFLLTMDTYEHEECEKCGKWDYGTCDEACFSNKVAIDLYNAGYRKQSEARWKGAGMGDYYCSRCCATYSGGEAYNYCPNCGANMKEGRE